MAGIPLTAELPQINITSVALHSDAVKKGSLFICLCGRRHDSHADALSAMQMGAVTLGQRAENGVMLLCEDTAKAAGKLLSAFYGHPSAHMNVTGITGTNGKTTTAYLLYQIANGVKRGAGLIGTLGAFYAHRSIDVGRTTPEADVLWPLLSDMKHHAVDTLVMEVSSQALDQQRVQGISFTLGIFMNLTRDHLDYHADMEAYYAAKRSLFEKCRQSKKMEISICHAGLVDAAVPLFHNDVLLGYISLGQMKRDTAFSSIYDRIRDYPVDMNIMEEYYNKLPLFDNEKIVSIANIAEVLAKYILLENMLQPSLDPIIEKAVAYIDAHLAQELTLDQITKSIHTSKSTLYRSFHTHFHCTISEYISRKRIDKSIELLRSSADLSVEEISRQTGFSSATNFIRTFRKLEGVTPLKFRKLQE